MVAQFLPKGIPENLRPDPSEVVLRINTALSSNQPSKHIKIVAASFNNQGYLIISTRSDQSASELLKFQDKIVPIIANLGNNQEVTLCEDKKWFKLQIDMVNTSSMSIGNGRVINMAEHVHSELQACNPNMREF